MQTMTHLELNSFSFFSSKNTRDYQHLIIKTKTNTQSKKRKLFFLKKNKQNSNSLPHSYRISQLYEVQSSTTLTLTERIKQRYFQPIKNAVAKITEIRQQQLPRRKSTYGLLFGQLTQKEMQNFPTIIEQHKQVNKQELALTSFAIMLERKQRKQTTRKLTKKLSKQESLIEYDNMERPPSCKTPPKIILTSKPKIKSKLQLDKERYFKWLDLKMFHFQSNKLYRQKNKKQLQKNVLPQQNQGVKQHFQTQSCASLRNLQICSFTSSPRQKAREKQSTEVNLDLPKQKSKSTRKIQRPYITHNNQLQKKILQTFEIKNTSWSKQNSLEQKQY